MFNFHDDTEIRGNYATRCDEVPLGNTRLRELRHTFLYAHRASQTSFFFAKSIKNSICRLGKIPKLKNNMIFCHLYVELIQGF